MLLQKQVSIVMQKQEFVEAEDEGEDPFAGDVSSIMVKADQIDNFNIAEWLTSILIIMF